MWAYWTANRQRGFSLILEGYTGQLYNVVKNDRPFSLYVSNKNVQLKFDKTAIADADFSLDVLRTGDGDPRNSLFMRKPQTVTDSQLQDARSQIEEDIAAFFEAQSQLGVDITGLVKKRDNLKEGDALPLSEVSINVTCKQQ